MKAAAKPVALTLVGVLLPLVGGMATATPQADAVAEPLRLDPVEVQAGGAPQRVRGAPWERAAVAVDALRDRHGPRADVRLWVRVRDGAGESSAPPVHVQLVPLDPAVDAMALRSVGIARFDLAALPRAVLREGELVVNRKAGQAELVPEVRTPGQAPRQVRVGDLRLQCAAWWAVVADATPWAMRVAVGSTGGPCRSGRIALPTFLPERARSVQVVEGDRRLAVTVERDGWSAWLPLHDGSWSDDAVVTWEPA